MSHPLKETTAGLGNIMPKPNFKTHVTIIKVYFRPLDFSFISQLTKGTQRKDTRLGACFLRVKQ